MSNNCEESKMCNDRGINNLWCIQSAIQKKELICVASWMNLSNIFGKRTETKDSILCNSTDLNFQKQKLIWVIDRSQNSGCPGGGGSTRIDWK